jgi:hypothetical protein
MLQKILSSLLIGTMLLASGARAEQNPPVVVKTKTVQQVIIPKDPLISAYLSAGAPGGGDEA